SASDDAKAKEDRDAVAGGDLSAQPAWQNYFYMAPNVRFTRTPEVHIRKQPAPDVAPARQDAVRQEEAAAPAPEPAAPGPRPSEPASRVASGRWANLSDHAFFELVEPR